MSSRIPALFVAAGVWLVAAAGPAEATPTLAYSFETDVPGGVLPPDGFFGLGATVTQESTIGVTHLEHSMKYEVGVAGFVGARTETVIPAELNDPPGVMRVLFDLTLTAPYTDTIADIGITVFGHALNADGGAQFGHQVQFADTVSIAALGVGTHLDLEIVLDQSVGPYRPGESFNDIFGPGADDLTVASAFQFFINKNVLTPVTVYIDNVRLDASLPEPATWTLLGLAGLVGCRRRVGGSRSGQR
jgi:hypothetical protein